MRVALIHDWLTGMRGGRSVPPGRPKAFINGFIARIALPPPYLLLIAVNSISLPKSVCRRS